MAKAKVKAKRLPNMPAIDMGPKERQQHDVIGLEPIAGGFRGERVIGHVAKVKAPFWLDKYHKRGDLAPGEVDENNRRFAAGDRLRATWTIAGLEPRQVGAYAELVARDTLTPVERKRDAYQRWVDAVRAVGIIASDEVITVCCLGEAIGRERMIILRRGLKVLADHYRL